MPNYDAILFDFDGVLIDSEPLHWKAWSEIVRPYGIEIDWPTYQRVAVGITDRKLVRVLAALGDPPADPQAIFDDYPAKRKLFLKLALAAPVISEETTGFIKSLQNYKLALVTSSFRSEVEPVLEAAGIARCFEVLIDSQQVQQHKPSPEPYLMAAKKLGAAHPLVVEDSDAGVASGRAAGFDVLRVASPAEMPGKVRAALAAP